MSQALKPNAVVRATSHVRLANGRKDPSKRYGFQSIGLREDEGMYSKFEQIFDAAESSHFLPPGDYEVVPDGAYLDRDGRLQIGKQFVRLLAPVAKP